MITSRFHFKLDLQKIKCCIFKIKNGEAQIIE